MCEKCTSPSPEAFADYIEKLVFGWRASRDGFGFLIWRRGQDYKSMSEEEAGVWHYTNDRFWNKNNGV